MQRRREGDSLDLMADALVQWAGGGTLVINHMVRGGEYEPEQSSAADPFISFKNVVRSALGPLEERHAAVDLATAAAVMADAVETAANRDGHGS